jgi:hypothetical protein
MWRNDLPVEGGGDWVDPLQNLIHGKWTAGLAQGKITYATIGEAGDEYSGEIMLKREGDYAVIRCGKGTMRWAGLDAAYCGDWNGDERKGHGVYNWPQGQVDGRWAGNKLHGAADLTLNTGQRFSGNWVEGKVDLDSEGGTWTGPDEDVYVGQWKAGLMHGQGAYKSTAALEESASEGRFCYFGEWRHGKLWCGLASWVQIIRQVGRDSLTMNVQASIRDGQVESMTPAKKLPVWAPNESELLQLPSRQWPVFDLNSIAEI